MSFLYARYGKAVIAGEVAVLGGTYYIYHQLTTSADYRAKMERYSVFLHGTDTRG